MGSQSVSKQDRYIDACDECERARDRALAQVSRPHCTIPTDEGRSGPFVPMSWTRVRSHGVSLNLYEIVKYVDMRLDIRCSREEHVVGSVSCMGI